MDQQGAKARLKELSYNDEMLFEIYNFVTENEGAQSEHIKSVAINMLRRLGFDEKQESEINELISLIVFN